MAAKGYSSAAAVAAYMGLTFTTDQTTQVLALMEAAEQTVDALSNSTYLTGPITNEQYNMTNRGAKIYLRKTPVTSVEGITIRSYQPGNIGQVLVVGQDYELIDPAAGLITLSGVWSTAAYYNQYGNWGGSQIYSESGMLLDGRGGSGSVALVSYTPVNVLPQPVFQATTQLLAFWMTNTVDPARFGITEVRTADQTLQVNALMAAGVIPDGVVYLLQKTVAKVLL